MHEYDAKSAWTGVRIAKTRLLGVCATGTDEDVSPACPAEALSVGPPSPIAVAPKLAVLAGLIVQFTHKEAGESSES